MPDEHDEQAELPAEEVTSPVEDELLKEHVDKSFITFSDPQSGHFTVSSERKRIVSNSFSHLLHLNSNIGISLRLPLYDK